MKYICLLLLLFSVNLSFSQKDSAYFKVRSQIKPPSDLLNDTREWRLSIYINDDSIIKRPYVVDWVYHNYKDDTIVNFISNRNELRKLKNIVLTNNVAFFADTIKNDSIKVFISKNIINTLDSNYLEDYIYSHLFFYMDSTKNEYKINNLEIEYKGETFSADILKYSLLYPNFEYLIYGLKPIEVFVDKNLVYVYIMGSKYYNSYNSDFMPISYETIKDINLQSFKNYGKICSSSKVADCYISKYIFDLNSGFIGVLSFPSLRYFNYFCDDFIGF